VEGGGESGLTKGVPKTPGIPPSWTDQTKVILPVDPGRGEKRWGIES
jgi:hypothetical protein